MITLKPARRASVPIVLIQTADAQQSIDTIIKEMNGAAQEAPIMRWDIVRGLVGLNKAGKQAVANPAVGGETPELNTQNPTECLAKLPNVPERSVVFFMNAQMFWTNESVKQAIWNLRDVFKMTRSMIALLAPLGTTLPQELKDDIVSLQDTLPTEPEITAIVDGLLKDIAAAPGATLKPDQITDKPRLIDALLGLSAFGAEQVFSMSCSKDDVDRAAMWETKKVTIEQTDGLKVYRGKERFADIGGMENAKKYLYDVCTGRDRVRAIVFIDEIEKSTAGMQSDSSGVAQDQHRQLLTWMQDRKVAGVLALGAPGTCKSALAKALGNEVGIPTIELDLGAMKGSLVGQSEARLRNALAVIDAISQGKVLVIATCNSVSNLSPELKRRFSLGTFFHPLPDKTARKKIWAIYLKKFGLEGQEIPNDVGWTGAEIETCCTIAWRLNRTLLQASKCFVPVMVSAKETIEKLCKEATNRYVSAETEGLFVYEPETQQGEVDKLARRAFGNG